MSLRRSACRAVVSMSSGGTCPSTQSVIRGGARIRGSERAATERGGKPGTRDARKGFMRTQTELIETPYHPGGPIYALARIVDFLFGLLYTLLLVRLVLEFVNATRNSGFFEFIRTVTDPFFAPFRGIVGTTSLDGSHRIVWPIVIAIVAYMIGHAVIRGLLRLIARA
jgi:uncharacterized protein YggT (Ycf19 family)